MNQTEQITLKFCVGSTNYTVPLGLRIFFDQQIIYETSGVSHPMEIQHSFADDDGEHELAIELFGKTSEHTKINEQGEILSDAMLTVDGIEIDVIDINYLFQQLAQYTHDFNGTRDLTQEKFFGALGCNGTVKFCFTTPVYLWFLENM